MKDTNHKYLCWLAGIRGIGKRKKFALLRAVSETSLFTSQTEGGAGEAGLLTSDADGGKDKDGLFTLAADYGREAAGRAARILYTAPEEELRFFCGEAYAAAARSRKAAELLLKARKQEAEKIEEELERAGISFVSALEKGFPVKLKEIPDPPFGIYCKGSMPAEDEPAAAIIGARLASGYGREQARRFGRRIGARKIAVISGMARGIDGIAQKAALDAGGKSYAVLGCGVDICYPEENRELYERLLREGGVLSEYPPGTFPEARLFPPRNRIISGLADLVLVIEARKRSGTLITVDMALEQGREVYALPGRVSDALSDGCNRLIRQGAGAATCPEDILEYFFGTGDEDAIRTWKKDTEQKHFTEDDSEKSAGRQYNIQSGTEEKVPEERFGESENPDKSALSLEQRILQVLSQEDEKHMERILEDIRMTEEQPEISARNNTLSDVIACLTRLKIDGRIEETAAGYYRRSSR